MAIELRKGPGGLVAPVLARGGPWLPLRWMSLGVHAWPRGEQARPPPPSSHGTQRCLSHSVRGGVPLGALQGGAKCLRKSPLFRPMHPRGTQEQRSQGGRQGHRHSLVASFHPRALIEHRLHAAAPPGGSCVRKKQTSKSVAWATTDRWWGPQRPRQRWGQGRPCTG